MVSWLNEDDRRPFLASADKKPIKNVKEKRWFGCCLSQCIGAFTYRRATELKMKISIFLICIGCHVLIFETVPTISHHCSAVIEQCDQRNWWWMIIMLPTKYCFFKFPTWRSLSNSIKLSLNPCMHIMILLR